MSRDVVAVLAAALAPENAWAIAYPVVAQEVRNWLENPGSVPLIGTVTTTELVDLLWPEKRARGEHITRRLRLFKALAALAEHDLSDCCTRGEPRKLKHGSKLVRPWLWHKPLNDDYAQVARKMGVSRNTVIEVLATWAKVQNDA